MTDRNYAELINLAAELATGKGLPTYPDGEFYATTPERERRRILKAMTDVDERCKDWAVRVRAVADRLSLGKSEVSK